MACICQARRVDEACMWWLSVRVLTEAMLNEAVGCVGEACNMLSKAFIC